MDTAELDTAVLEILVTEIEDIATVEDTAVFEGIATVEDIDVFEDIAELEIYHLNIAVMDIDL